MSSVASGCVVDVTIGLSRANHSHKFPSSYDELTGI